MATDSRTAVIKYVYELPFIDRTEICKLLNQNDKWEDLAGTWMKFDVLTIQSLRKEKNPTDELLTLWGNYNHTILELFVLLAHMKDYQTMAHLKAFVDPKFHRLLRSAGSTRVKVANKQVNKDNTKDLKIGTQNFNQSVPRRPNVPKVMLPSNSNNLLVVTPVVGVPDFTEHRVKNNNKETPLLKPEATLPHAAYAELALATNAWNKHNVLGKGGFGTVYRGIWKNTDVAIKKIARRGPDSDESYLLQLEQSLREIKILNSRVHENILSLYAYSHDGEAPCLVYQLMPNGSLEDRLFLKERRQPLSWLQRHQIAKGTARGLQYLHTIGGRPLIHGDIKSANILLDKNLEPKLGDFGLAREGPEKDSMKVSKIHGTRPYLPEEFLHHRRLSTKVDTYSYGVVLLELATGLSAFDDSREKNKFLKDFIDSLEDEDIPLYMDKKAGERDQQVYNNLIVLGKWCANLLAQNRPEMELVFRKLNNL